MAAEERAEAEPGGPVLTAKLSSRWLLRPVHVALALVLSLLFLLFNYTPLRGTDLWGHVALGNFILREGHLPESDPTMPLAAGMQVVDTSWLSQVILAGVDRAGGPHWLSHLFALTMIASFGLLAAAFYRVTGRVSLAAAGVVLAVVAGWSRLLTIRPENFAFLCLAALLLLITCGADRASRDETRRPSLWLWIGGPLLMALWANLHGSFIIGIGVLACYFLGRLLSAAWERQTVAGVLGDRGVRDWLLVAELSAAATLLNPYGVDLWLHVLAFSSNENVFGLIEWRRLAFLEPGGREFVVSAVVLILLLRHSRRPVPAAHAILLAVLGLGSMMGSRMLTWYAPVMALVSLPLLAELIGRWLPAAAAEPAAADNVPEEARPVGWAWAWSLLVLLVVWCAFAVAPLAQPVLGGPLRGDSQLYDSESTPLELTAWLAQPENAPRSLVFCPQHWADWLQRSTPYDFRPLVSMNVHMAPRQVWSDYERVLSLRPGWSSVLDRYRIDMLIVDLNQQPDFRRLLRDNDEWELKHEDEQALVYVRRSKG